MKTWFSIQAKADNTAEISIHDEIGMWGVTAKDFISALKEHKGKAITLSINSPGGSVFDALAIYNALRQHGSEITTKTMGIAASAASVVFMAGDKRQMPENAFLMIHNPMTGTWGNADEMREVADVLDKIAASLISIYAKGTGLADDEVKALLDNETWMNAADALDKKFSTETLAEFKAAASFDIERLPENIRAVFEAKQEPVKEGDVQPSATLAEQITAAAASAGLSDHLNAFLLDKAITDEAGVALAVAHAREISSLCAVAKQPAMAGKLISERASIEQARAALCDALAVADESTRTDQHRRTEPPKAQTGKDVWAKVLASPIYSKRQTKES